MFNALVPEGLAFVRKSLHETVGTVDNNIVTSCLSVMDSLLRPYKRELGGCFVSCFGYAVQRFLCLLKAIYVHTHSPSLSHTNTHKQTHRHGTTQRK